MPNDLRRYLASLQAILATGEATEHSYRAALADLVTELDPALRVINEPKRIACGAPDLAVYRDQVPIGYLEAKDIGTALDAVESGEQMARYLDALGNLILTNYVEFRWYRDGAPVDSARLGIVGSDGALRRERGGAQSVSRLLERFLAAQAVTVGTAKELAQRMAGLARLLRAGVLSVFETKTDSTLHQEFQSFKSVLLHDLTPAQFADMYAQTVCYGLFSARCSAPPGDGFSRRTAAYLLPKTNPFLKEMFANMAGPGAADEIEWIIEALCDLLQHAHMAAILQDFGQRTRREDPVVHFYETFLQAYDPALREMRGVYYTPEPVVSYIVRSVDRLLRDRFDCPHGLADAATLPADDIQNTTHRVHILDPACGTGTFLHAVINTIHADLSQHGQAGAWSGYVPRHLLPRLHGFELLMAPYAVAHLKLGLQLQELGYDFRADDRLQVYLTNSLEQAQDAGQSVMFAPAIAREVNAANAVKETVPVMVVLGNPPYSGHSANKSPWLDQLLRGLDARNGAKVESYFQVDGGDLGERNPKWLNDDYVKFIRFAQWRIQRTGYGVLAFITNHGYLDNPTFRGMRQSLMADFDSIYLLDLHGNAKKRETCPDGSPDENVFDIQQGVAIGLFVKDGRRAKGRCQVHHADLYGLRADKYAWLWEHDVESTDWQDVSPAKPFYLLKPQDATLRDEYHRYPNLTNIMPVSVLGFQTHRDHFAIAFDRETILRRIADLRDERLSDDELRSRYRLRDNRDWSLAEARQALRADDDWERHIIRCLYRPFDWRWCYFSTVAMDYPRRELLDHVAGRENLCVLSSRQQGTPGYRHSLVAQEPANDCVLSTRSREANHVFPLWKYAPSQASGLTVEQRTANLEEATVTQLQPLIGIDDANAVAERACAYIYAILSAPSYRTRYEAFLRTDFPHIPFTTDPDLFAALASLGQELIDVHLMRAPSLSRLITAYPVNGDNRVARVDYQPPAQDCAGRVWINATQYIEGVSPDLWEYQIGGYQVLDKWLRDRRKRVLTYEEIIHYQRIVVALAETQRLQREIDAVIEAHGGWPIAQPWANTKLAPTTHRRNPQHSV